MKLGMGELVVILVIALLILGPSKLPEVGKSVGQAFSEFKKQVNNPGENDNESENEKKDE